MLSPDELLHISEGGEEIGSQLHSEIIRKMVYHIMLRIGRGEEYLLTATDKWQIETLQQAGYLLEDIQKEISKYTKLQEEEIKEAMEDAGIKALEYDDKIYRDVGLSPIPLIQSPQLVRIMQRNYEATMGEWNNFTRTMAFEAQKNFIYQLDKAYNLVSSGAMSYTEAVKDVVNSIASEGVKVEYKRLDENGNLYVHHVDTIETATLRAIRTGVSQGTAQIQIARMKEMGAGLAITSSHLGARPSHQVWQGQVFSIDWTKMNKIYPLPNIRTPENLGAEEYPDFVENTRIGKVDGLCGVNCRHSFSVFYEGMDNPFEQYDSEENRKQYEKEQRQRELERRIRNTKREVMAKKEAVDDCKDDKTKFELDLEYQRKSALLAKQNKAYRDYCTENGLKPLNDRIQIARWDRQQAAAARGAAQKYKNKK